MTTKKWFLHLSLAAIVFTSVLVACKKKFDEPPYNLPVNITANTTIAALKAMHTVSGAYDNITTDIVIKGVVIANDKSGNLYQDIYIQDATGSINVMLNQNSLYGNYPVGKEVFIKCNGLTLSDYGNMIQLGMMDRSVPGSPSLDGIPAALIDRYVIRGSSDNPVPVTNVTTITSLSTSMQNAQLGTLVRLSGYEFAKGDTNKIWSDTSAFKNSVNLTIKDCSGANSIIIRTSGYANFAGVKVPKGNGTITALYTVFGSTRQLVLLDTADVKFNNARCFLFEEDFQSYATTGSNPLVIPGWRNIQETGDVAWRIGSFSGNIYPQASAFTSTALPTTNISSWLITPDINVPNSGSPKFSYTCARRYIAGTLKVYVSTNYTGSNLTTATWTLLNTVPNGTNAGFTPQDPFGPFDFNAYKGQKVNIAFRYEATAGTTASNVATFQPDNLAISAN